MPLSPHDTPLGAIDEDAALPTLAGALEPATAQAALIERLPPKVTSHAIPLLQGIRVLAYKPGRRCLIEYRCSLQSASDGPRDLVVLGKIRANRFGNGGFRQLRALWDAGLDDMSRHGISVPEPVATVPSLRMWLQRRVEGASARDLLLGPHALAGAARIADAVCVLHDAHVPAERRHTIDDEMQILERCLADVARAYPVLTSRLMGLLGACGRAAALLPEPSWCGSHRDFYADQVLITGTRVTLLDFDLYCDADPGLDVGNFNGHLAEQSLRFRNRDDALTPVECALEDGFIARAGESVRQAVRVYTALTLARHVFLSTRFADRAPLLPSVLASAEQRIGAVLAEGGHA